MYPPKKPKNLEQRPREYLLFEELEQMILAISESNYRTQIGEKKRNTLLILMMYVHGLRVSEVVALRWDQISLNERKLRVARYGRGIDSDHRLEETEYQMLRELWDSTQRYSSWSWFNRKHSDYIFDLRPRTVHYIVEWAGKLAKLPFPVHPQMLRHGCGYYLATKLKDPVAVQQYLGLKSPSSVMRYFGHSPVSLKNLWDKD